MLSLQWYYSKARIWVDELPNWHYKETEIIERQIDATMPNKLIHESSAIELFVPIGARFYNGALAITFVPAATGPLVIQAPISGSEDTLGTENILQDTVTSNKLDTLLIGLLPSYANGIFDGILNTATAQLLGSGTLYISGAAYGAVGSSFWMFKVLSRIAVKLLTLEPKDMSDEQLIKLIQAEWTNARMAQGEKKVPEIFYPPDDKPLRTTPNMEDTYQDATSYKNINI